MSYQRLFKIYQVLFFGWQFTFWLQIVILSFLASKGHYLLILPCLAPWLVVATILDALDYGCFWKFDIKPWLRKSQKWQPRRLRTQLRFWAWHGRCRKLILVCCPLLY